MTLRPPYVGDVLLDPQRVVTWVDRVARTIRCEPLHGSLDDCGDLPDKMRGKGWEAAPIEPGWTELPVLVAHRSSHTGD